MLVLHMYEWTSAMALLHCSLFQLQKVLKRLAGSEGAHRLAEPLSMIVWLCYS
jgi:hypothetical protein